MEEDCQNTDKSNVVNLKTSLSPTTTNNSSRVIADKNFSKTYEQICYPTSLDTNFLLRKSKNKTKHTEEILNDIKELNSLDDSSVSNLEGFGGDKKLSKTKIKPFQEDYYVNLIKGPVKVQIDEFYHGGKETQNNNENFSHINNSISKIEANIFEEEIVSSDNVTHCSEIPAINEQHTIQNCPEIIDDNNNDMLNTNEKIGECVETHVPILKHHEDSLFLTDQNISKKIFINKGSKNADRTNEKILVYLTNIETNNLPYENIVSVNSDISSSSFATYPAIDFQAKGSCERHHYQDYNPGSNTYHLITSNTKCIHNTLSTSQTSSRSYNSILVKSTSEMDIGYAANHLQPKQKTVHKNKLKINSSVKAIELLNSNNALTSECCTNCLSKLKNSPQETGKKRRLHKLQAISNLMKPNSVNKDVHVGIADAVYELINGSTKSSIASVCCQYSPLLRTKCKVNVIAKTIGEYLLRAPPCSTITSNHGVNHSVNRLYPEDIAFRKNIKTNEVYAKYKEVLAEVARAVVSKDNNNLRDNFWADCEEHSDIEEICTCYDSKRGCISFSLNQSKGILNNVKESEPLNLIQMTSIAGNKNSNSLMVSSDLTVLLSDHHQRKRKYNESTMASLNNISSTMLNSGSAVNNRKRIAYDYSATPRSSCNSNAVIIASASYVMPSHSILSTTGSASTRRNSRSIIPTRENPPPELQNWLAQFLRWSHAERLLAVDRLIEHCEPTQVRHMMKVIEPQFQRDFISLLPRELALQVLAYLDPLDLLRGAQTCRSWRFLCDDNLLWKEKCRKAEILTELRSDRPRRGRAGSMPHIASPWKSAYIRQHIIEMNWRSRAIREPKILKGHDDHVITCLQFSGNRIVSGSDDNTLKVWSAVTGRCLRTLVGHTGGVWSSQMSGNIIVSGSTDRTLKVWDMETGQCVHTLLGHTSTVRCMHLHGKLVVSGSRDATLRVWDIEQGSCLHVLVGHLAAVRCVQYDGKLIVSGAYDYMVKIWHPERQECLHTLQGHTNRVYSLQFDGIHVVSGSLDTSIRVWDVESGGCKHTLMGHQSLTSGMELRQNILVSGNADSTVKVWDITTGQCLQTLSGPNKHQSAVTCLQFNSRFVVTSSDDGTVKLWDVKTGEFIRNLVALDSGGSGGVVWRIRANDTKLICAVGSRNGTEETKLMVLDFDVEGACAKCSEKQ